MAPTEFRLVRSGRRYELRRGDETVGEVRRRGIVKRRYEADFGGRTWVYVGDGRKAGVNPVLDADGRECASLEGSDEGFGIVLDDEPVPMTLMVRSDGTRDWVGGHGSPLLRLAPDRRAWLQKNGLVATLEQTEQSWPGSDPEGSQAVAAATICAWFVQDLDQAGTLQFNKLTALTIP